MNKNINYFDRLPVFQIGGGTEVERKNFIEKLLCELEALSLRAAIVPPEDRCTLLCLYSLAKTHDLVLVTGDVDFPLQMVLCKEDESGKEGELSPIVCRNGNINNCIADLIRRLDFLVCKTPVWGCILIGGRSSRMGKPKHLIKGPDGKTWLENTIATISLFVDGVVVVGAGDIPEELAGVTRLPDIPGIKGPVSGILSASRWQPLVSWLLVACDMPLITKEALAWLLSDRRAGDWGRVPLLEGASYFEPLLAFYDFRSRQLFEEQVCIGNMRIGRVGSDAKIANPVVPDELRHCWKNVNTPEQLKKVRNY